MEFKDDKNDCDKAPHYNCDACKRIVNVLNYYHKWNQYHSPKNSTSSSDDNNGNNNNIIDKEYDVGMFEYINSSYDLTQLNDDYIHIVEDHSDELEELYKYTLKQLNIVSCNIGSCKMIERNNRSRSRFATDVSLRKSLYNGYETSEEISTQQILDKIHSYILHSFDSLKLTNDEIDRIELIQDKPCKSNNVDGDGNKSIDSDTDDDDDGDDDDETKPLKDETLKEYKKIMDDKKRIMRDITNVRQKSNKFASDHYENDRKQYCDQEDEKKDINMSLNQNLEDQESEMEDESDNDFNKKKLETYSFGIRWYYWEYYKDLVVMI